MGDYKLRPAHARLTGGHASPCHLLSMNPRHLLIQGAHRHSLLGIAVQSACNCRRRVEGGLQASPECCITVRETEILLHAMHAVTLTASWLAEGGARSGKSRRPASSLETAAVSPQPEPHTSAALRPGIPLDIVPVSPAVPHLTAPVVPALKVSAAYCCAAQAAVQAAGQSQNH